jgi:CRISPR-associated protein Csa2
MKVVFLSLGLRAIVNVEALNMVESVGNIIRHRKVALVYRRGDSYLVRWVPAISGESMAHSYQAWLADLAEKRNLPVCEYCKKHEFVKHADAKVFGSEKWEQELKNKIDEFSEKLKGESKGKTSSSDKKSKGKSNISPEEALKFMDSIERKIVENCVVEDIGGFLYAGEPPVKRTSRFATSYMVPSLDNVERATIETQFQVRHAPTASQKWDQAQMIYNVEVGSAIYAWSFYIDLSQIGCTSMVTKECLKLEDRKARIELAIDALALMLDTKIFGAKQSRYAPIIDYEIIVATLSDPLPFTVSPPAIGLEFVKDTMKRAKAFKDATKAFVKIYAYTKDSKLVDVPEKSDVDVYVGSTIIKMFETIKKDALKMIG